MDWCRVSPALLVEVAGERLTVELFGEVILPPQDAVPVLLVVPLTGRNVRTLRQNTDVSHHPAPHRVTAF